MEMRLQHSPLRLFLVPFQSNFIPRRYRFKKKWAMNLKTETNCKRALSNFDAFYKPHFADQWPSIRVCLLSLPKYCAVTNKYGKSKEAEIKLEDLSASNFVQHARKLLRKRVEKEVSSSIDITAESTQQLFSDSSDRDETELSSKTYPIEDSLDASDSQIDDKMRDSNFIIPGENAGGILEPYDEDLYKENISVFVPTEQVFSEKDQLLREEMTLNTFQPGEVAVKFLPSDSICIPRNIDAYIFPRGDLTRFPQPRPHNGIFEYYLMDAASVMPVIALDVQPTDKVLDLCAAPGGKSYLILQNLDFFSDSDSSVSDYCMSDNDPEFVPKPRKNQTLSDSTTSISSGEEGGMLTCNDSAQGRVTRLRNVLNSYVPPDIVDQISVTKKDGREPFSPIFNKVLVDAPCNSDRHVVTEDENNLFKASRTGERLGLMQIQKELLISAIKSCVPGGTIVYSTCTLSPAQNDGVIQAAFEYLWENSEIEVAVQDLSSLSEMFGHAFKFHRETKYGQLILPSLVHNFGPSYFSKLKRVK